MNDSGSSESQRQERTKEVLAKIDAFPAMPAFIVKAVQLLNDPGVDMDRVASTMKYDPGLTANLLRFANSAQYGDVRSVHDVHGALVRLGVRKALELTVAYGIADRLVSPLSGYNLEPRELLRHSVSVAVTAEKFCQVVGLQKPSMLFTAGILHDLGKIVLDEYVGKYYDEINRAMEEGCLFFEEAEKEVIGLNHAEVGARLLSLWKLPDELVAAACWHHHPERSESHGDIASVVHVADVLAYAQGVGAGVDGLKQRPCKSVIDEFEMDHKAVDQVVLRAYREVDDLANLLHEEE